jgi:glyoxylase-like metal-dependent hydrolase (beta-lactamase superfamily II)
MQEITSKIYMLNGLRGTGVLSTNVYFLLGNKLTIIDTGYKGRVTQICHEINRLGYSLSDVENIILTHHHVDHTGNLFELQKLSGARIIAHIDEAPYIEGGLPHFCPQSLGRLKFTKNFWNMHPVNVDIKVEDGDILPVLNGVKVLHTPGHTPGSIALLVPGDGVILAGDLLANTFGLSLPSKMFTCDIRQEIESICKIAELDFNIICFGHGLPIIKDTHGKLNTFAEKLKRTHPEFINR